MAKKITVFGSFVVDLMARAPHLPVTGETVKGSLFQMGPGGKGFNQAVAAHKVGAQVTMVTKLGRDDLANVALDTMKSLKMPTDHVFFSETSSTGSALICVDECTSQNQIIVVSGACDTITTEEVSQAANAISQADFLLTQLETNMDAIEQTIDLAHKNNVSVILNPAPVRPLRSEMLSKVDYITPNEVEAETLTGICVDSLPHARDAAAWFFDRGVGHVVITLGSRGVYVANRERDEWIEALQVKAVDTTGAGDAFNGGLVAGLAQGLDLWQAARFANALAALSVQRLGTTASMPTREELHDFCILHHLPHATI